MNTTEQLAGHRNAKSPQSHTTSHSQQSCVNACGSFVSSGKRETGNLQPSRYQNTEASSGKTIRNLYTLAFDRLRLELSRQSLECVAKSGTRLCLIAGLKWIRDIGRENAKHLHLKNVKWLVRANQYETQYIEKSAAWLSGCEVCNTVIDDSGGQLRYQAWNQNKLETSRSTSDA